MKTQVMKVEDIATQLRGVSYAKEDASYSPAEGLVPILRANNITEHGLDFNGLVYVPKSCVKDKQLIKKGDVVIAASSGSIQVVGKAAYAEADFYGSFGAFCKVLRPSKLVDAKYFSYFFQTPFYRNTISSLAAGANINNLKNEHLDDFEIPLPPLAEQIHIAQVLDQADRLRQQDRQLLAHYDQLVQAVFVEMFGDPVRNEKGWPVKTIGESVEFLTSGSRGWAAYYAESGSKFLRIQNLVKGQLRLDDIAYVNAPTTAEAKRTRVKAGDVLLSITADLGRTAFIPQDFGEAYISQHLALLRFNSEIQPNYASQLLTSGFGQRQILKANKGGVKAGLNFDDVKSIKLLAPPVTLQQKFAEIVTQIEAQKAATQQLQAQSEALFNSLLQQAFRGELGRGPAGAPAGAGQLALALG